MGILNTIREQTATLNAVSDELAAKVRQVEQCLQPLGIPLEVVVPNTSYHLVFARCGGLFRLCVRVISDLVPWSDCSRDLKAQTAKAIPALLAEAEQQTTIRIAELKAILE